MSSLIDKLNQRNENQKQKSNGYVKTSTTNMKWKDGKNVGRCVGDYVETHTHSLSPNSFGSIGVADEASFKGKGFIPFEVTCTDWDLKTEKYNRERTCPFCKLYGRACKALKRKDLTAEEKKTFEQIKEANKPSKKIKWNFIDRDAPYYIKVNGDKKEEQVKGLKVASYSFGQFNDIKGIVEQNGLDISDPDTGIDIIVTKGKEGDKVKYSIQACIEKLAVKVTPLTDEEKSWKKWDFVDMYSKPYDFAAIKSKMHENFRIVLELSDEEFDQTIGGTEGAATSEDTPPVDAEDDEDSKKNLTADEENLPF